MTATPNTIKILVENQSQFTFTPDTPTSHCELDGYCVEGPEVAASGSTDDNGGIYSAYSSQQREYLTSPDDDITAISVYRFDDPRYLLILLVAKSAENSPKCKVAFWPALGFKPNARIAEKIRDSDKYGDVAYCEFAKVGPAYGPTLKVSGHFLSLGLGQQSSAVFTIQSLVLASPKASNYVIRYDAAVAVTLKNETEYVFKPTATAQAAGFPLRPPQTVNAKEATSGGEWGGQSKKGRTFIPSLIEALAIYRWEEDPESVLIFVVSRMAGGDPVVKVDIRPEIGPVPTPELVKSILDDDSVTNKVVRDNLAVVGSLVSKPYEKGSVTLNPVVFEVQYDIKPSLENEDEGVVVENEE